MTTTIDPPRTPKRKARSWITTICVLIFLLFVAVAVFMPGGCRSRESANRVKCAANLKQIGQALLAYATAHNGQYPDSLQTLILSDADLGAEVFACPSSNDERIPGNAPADIAASFSQPHHLSYTYYGRGLTTSANPDTPLMADILDNHDNDGVNILFTDGHADFHQRDDARRILGDKLVLQSPTSQPTTHPLP